MTEKTIKILTIQATSEAGEIYYPDFFEQEEDDKTEFSFSVTQHLAEAVDLNEVEKEDQITIFEAFDRAYEEDFNDVKLINATITTVVEDVAIQDEYAEVLQKRALEKLTPSEMKALDVMKLFTYIKLKFHKTA